MDERARAADTTRADVPSGRPDVDDVEYDDSEHDENEYDDYHDEDTGIIRSAGFVGGRDESSMARDDIIFLVFALIVGTLLMLYYLPLGLLTIWVFTAAAWLRRRRAVVRWVLTLVAVVLLLGVGIVTATS